LVFRKSFRTLLTITPITTAYDKFFSVCLPFFSAFFLLAAEKLSAAKRSSICEDLSCVNANAINTVGVSSLECRTSVLIGLDFFNS